MDVLDSLASSVRMDVANNKVMRVVPLLMKILMKNG